MPGVSLVIICLSACLYLTGARIIQGRYIYILYICCNMYLSPCLYLTGARIIQGRYIYIGIILYMYLSACLYLTGARIIQGRYTVQYIVHGTVHCTLYCTYSTVSLFSRIGKHCTFQLVPLSDVFHKYFFGGFQI